MTESCHWPGCKVDGRAWCDEHYRMLPGHLRAAVARGDAHAEFDAVAWVRSTFDPSPRERWDPGKWERLVRFVRDRDEARARRRAAAVIPSGGARKERGCSI